MKVKFFFTLFLSFYSISIAYGLTPTRDSRDLIIQSAQEAQKKVLIAVGISNYNQNATGLRPLRYAANDAYLLANTFQKNNYIVKKLINSYANKNRILNEIKQAGKLFHTDQGTLVFSFSGHGFKKGNISYLAAYDSIATELRSSGVNIQEIINAIRATKVRRAILLIDACRNDPTPGIRDSGRKALGGGIYLGKGIQVLYSTRSSDVSWEHDSLRQGVFSYFVNKALNGAAKNNGIVTFSGLSRYVEREVAQWTNTRFPETQQPHEGESGEKFGDFVMIMNQRK